eukprot:6736967-Pyramimonas_sp.AAC.2
MNVVAKIVLAPSTHTAAPIGGERVYRAQRGGCKSGVVGHRALVRPRDSFSGSHLPSWGGARCIKHARPARSRGLHVAMHAGSRNAEPDGTLYDVLGAHCAYES